MKFCPPNYDNIDPCIIAKVVDKQNNSTFGSQLTCRKNHAWHNVCDFWNVPGLCESSAKDVVIDASVAHSKIEQLEKCFYLRFSNATVDGHNTSLFCPSEEPKVEMDCDVYFDSETVGELFSGATDNQVWSSHQFWMFFMMLIVSWAGMAVVVSIGDAICFEMLGPKPQRFGLVGNYWGEFNGWT